MPNHFHLLMQQCEDSPTLSAFMKKISVTYAMYFQYQYHHSGGLFQGKFRSVQFYRDDSLLYVSKYIHLNPRGMEGSDPSIYLWSSLGDYLNSSNKNWLHPEVIFNTFFAKSGDPRREYKQYIFTPADAEKEILLRKMEGSDPSLLFKKQEGVEELAAAADFKVKVRTGGPAGRTDVADDVPAVNRLADGNTDTTHMGVKRG